MESPHNRPVAVNLIDRTIDEWYSRPHDIAGFSLEMTIYHALSDAGYLTESAQVRDKT